MVNGNLFQFFIKVHKYLSKDIICIYNVLEMKSILFLVYELALVRIKKVLYYISFCISIDVPLIFMLPKLEFFVS